ncbi:MAG: sulfatase-like hydrolase/transferase [Halobacteriaceae archaeon]
MPRSRPNVLWITTDQQHFDTLGVVNDEIETPNLDRLVGEGTLFDRAYCPNPTCTPTRASMITGQLPSQHGAYSLGTKLPESAHVVGDDFSDAGYETSLIGKAHFQPLDSTEEFESLEAYPTLQDLEFWSDFHGPFYGFDHVELARNHTDEAHVGQHYALWMEEQGFEDWRDCFREPTGNREAQHGTWNIPEEYHYDAWIAERTNARLERHAEADEPFFCWASFFDPHPSYLVPEPWSEMYDPEELTIPHAEPGEHDDNPPHFRRTQEEDPHFPEWDEMDQPIHGFGSHLHDEADLAEDVAIYYGMVSMLDAYVGRVLDRLDELGLAEDTVVVFTSDHGHLYGQHGLTAKGPFHYEDLLRVPTVVRYPGEVPAGRRCSALQSLQDLAPTVLNLCGLDAPREMTGVDQSAVWRGDRASAREHVLVENNHEPGVLHCQTYVDERYKLTAYQGESYGELFDLEEDPDELHNRWDDPDYRDLKTELLRELLSARMGAQSLWMPRIAGA